MSARRAKKERRRRDRRARREARAASRCPGPGCVGSVREETCADCGGRMFACSSGHRFVVAIEWHECLDEFDDLDELDEEDEEVA